MQFLFLDNTALYDFQFWSSSTRHNWHLCQLQRVSSNICPWTIIVKAVSWRSKSLWRSFKVGQGHLHQNMFSSFKTWPQSFVFELNVDVYINAPHQFDPHLKLENAINKVDLSWTITWAHPCSCFFKSVTLITETELIAPEQLL